jgi:hypothetical protein
MGTVRSASQRGAAQWIGAVVLLAVMVFGITFALNYLGRPKTPAGGGPGPDDTNIIPARSLRFARTVFPESEKEPGVEAELNASGHYDFWFANDNDEDLAVGLKSKGCRCSNIEMKVMPPEWKQNFLKLAEANKKATLQEQLRFAGEVDDSHLRQLEGKEKPVVVEHSGTFGKVPAGAFGRIRVQWKRDKGGPQVLWAQLWTDQPDNESARLQLKVLILEPLQTRPEWPMGTILARDLPTKDFAIVCWSATRKSIKVKADRASAHQEAKSDPFVVGQPVPMSDQEREQVAQATGMRRIQCAYRIPITLRAVSEDGSMPFDLGPFRRWVVLTAGGDEGIDPVRTVVSGRIEGDVTVGSPNDAGMVSFGVFERQRGARRTVTLQSTLPGLELKLDPDHKVPDYLQVKLSEKAETGQGGNRTWKLHVEASPGRARPSE